MLDILKKIKKLKVKEVRELNEKLIMILSYKKQIWHDTFDADSNQPFPVIDIDDIEQALTYCIFHFKGGMLESFGLEDCPCNCHCQSCEMIPENDIGLRMQAIAKDMTEENVFEVFKLQYGDPDWVKEYKQSKESNGK